MSKPEDSITTHDELGETLVELLDQGWIEMGLVPQIDRAVRFRLSENAVIPREEHAGDPYDLATDGEIV